MGGMEMPTPQKTVDAVAQVQRKHPQATLTVGTGTTATVVVWFATEMLHVPMDATVGAAFATVISAAALFIGRQGLKGAFLMIWRGKPKDDE